jgi:serine/threonine protein kinase
MPGDESTLIRQLYAAALQRDPEERDEYLDAACAGRPEVRARVSALLTAHARDFDGPTSLSQTPTTDSADAGHPATADGRMVGSYIIRRQLGQGGMGVVYLADDTRLQRRVALKALNPALAESPGLRERLRNEARVAAGLSHPGIATVYALEDIDNELYMVYEFVPGSNLRSLLKSGPLPMREIVSIGLQLARALAEAHTYGIVHRDLKPENVIKTPSGVVKILDFGLALGEHGTQPRLTHTGIVVGTPAYLAPEQVRGQQADFRSDLFALGLLLYELASGTNPFMSHSVTTTIAKIVEEDPPSLCVVRAQSEPELDRIVKLCLRKNPAERYQSTQDVVADLAQLSDEITARVRVTPVAGTPPLPAPAVAGAKHRWLVTHQIIVSVIYLAMLYPVWYARGWLPPPWGMLFTLGVLAAAAAMISLRLHLWFTARQFPHRLVAEQAETWRRTRIIDVGYAVMLAAGALTISGGHPEFAMLFVAVSTAMLVVSFVIEPATAAALRDRGENP